MSLVYVWDLALQQPGAPDGAANCWMTQSVVLVGGGQVLRSGADFKPEDDA